MTTAALKKEIKKVIESIDDNRILEAVYVLLNNNARHAQYELSSEDLAILEERQAAYKSGKLKTYTVQETKKKILKKHGK